MYRTGYRHPFQTWAADFESDSSNSHENRQQISTPSSEIVWQNRPFHRKSYFVLSHIYKSVPPNEELDVCVSVDVFTCRSGFPLTSSVS